MDQFKCVICGQIFPNGVELETCAGCGSRVCKKCFQRTLCNRCNLSLGPEGQDNYDKKMHRWIVFKRVILILAIIIIPIGITSYIKMTDYHPENYQSNFLVENGIVFIILGIGLFIIFKVLKFCELWIFEDWAKKELKKHSQL